MDERNGDEPEIPPAPPPPVPEPPFTAPPIWERGRPVELRPRTFGELIDGAANMYRLYWRSLMGIVALLVVPVQFLEEYLTRNYRHSALGGIVARGNHLSRVVVIVDVILLIQLLVVRPLLTAALARGAAAFHLGEEPTAGDLLDYGLARLWSVMLVLVLFTLVVAGGFILLIIPGIIFLVRFAFAPAVVVLEGIRGREALRRSWRLTHGSFWRVLGILFVAGLMAGIVASLISIPANLWAHSIGRSGWPIRAIGGSVASVLTTPFVSLVTVLLYLDLRVRREALDLDRLSWELAAR